MKEGEKTSLRCKVCDEHTFLLVVSIGKQELRCPACNDQKSIVFCKDKNEIKMIIK